MAQDFTGKVAIVNGGASGIGAAVCRQLAAGGTKVAGGVYIRVAAQSLADEPAEAVAVQVDVAVADDVRRMVEVLVDLFWGLLLAVIIGGIGGPSHPAAE